MDVLAYLLEKACMFFSVLQCKMALSISRYTRKNTFKRIIQLNFSHQESGLLCQKNQTFY